MFERTPVKIERKQACQYIKTVTDGKGNARVIVGSPESVSTQMEKLKEEWGYEAISMGGEALPEDQTYRAKIIRDYQARALEKAARWAK